MGLHVAAVDATEQIAIATLLRRLPHLADFESPESWPTFVLRCLRRLSGSL
jgi:hypothetical protein